MVASNMTVTSSHKHRKAKAVKALIFDCDDTLYRAEEVPRACRAAIERYMVQRLGVPQDKVSALTTELYLKYGTTMAGLVATGHILDYDNWHSEVHHKAIDYNHLLHPDLLLREILCSIDLPKYILTNADKHHAELVLARLGIEDCFQGVFHFEWMMESAKQHNLLTDAHPVLCKPMAKTYELVLEAIGCEPSEVIFFDDSARNVSSAHEMGILTVCVGRDEPLHGADICMATLHQLPAHLPELFEQQPVQLAADAREGSGTDLVVAVEV